MDLSTLDSEKSCCFTGHRILPPEKLQDIQLDIQNNICELYKEGIKTFYAGGALGFDMLAGITVLNLKIQYPDLRLFLSLPYDGHDVFWPDTQQQLLKRLLSHLSCIQDLVLVLFY